MPDRAQIAWTTAKKLTAAIPSLPKVNATIGLDGFVDEIIAVVDKRHGFEPMDITPYATIAQLGKRISDAAGESANIELVVKQMKLGGNGPIMANALASAGLAVSYIGSLGYPVPHPVFKEMIDNAREVISVCDAGHTDALEFTDGKLMIGKLTMLNEMNWENLVARVGPEKLLEMFDRARLVAVNNWTMLPRMNEVWEKLSSVILPRLSKATRTMFIDLADPAKRTQQELSRGMSLLSGFQKHIDVTLGLNLSECEQVARVLGIDLPADSESHIESTAQKIRAKMGIGCVVIHPRKAAAAATADASASFAGPFVKHPKLSTGAGDNFNAGFCLGRSIGLDLAESLCAGVATSGFYVRNAKSPTAQELAAFVAELPPAEG